MRVSEPSYIAGQILVSQDEEHGIVDVLRHQRLQDSLSALLLEWTPVHIQENWTPREILFVAKAFVPTAVRIYVVLEHMLTIPTAFEGPTDHYTSTAAESAHCDPMAGPACCCTGDCFLLAFSGMLPTNLRSMTWASAGSKWLVP